MSDPTPTAERAALLDSFDKAIKEKKFVRANEIINELYDATGSDVECEAMLATLHDAEGTESFKKDEQDDKSY